MSDRGDFSVLARTHPVLGLIRRSATCFRCRFDEMQMSDHGSFGVRRQVVAFHVGLGIAIHECAPARGVPATHAEVRIVVPLLPGVPSLTPG